ncbi:MAG: glycosyltransferase [Acidobacteriaceae bacterium]
MITAIYNGEKYIAGCLESVLQQDYPGIEHIVLDGGSTDQTVDILRRYDDRVEYWASEPDNGVYDAWNKGLTEARGDWICFLGADDEFLPGAISAYMEMARDNPQAEYLGSQVEWVHESGYSHVIEELWNFSSGRSSCCPNTPWPRRSTTPWANGRN